jgi:thioredoxin-like negative regulator of GroEL
MLKQIKQLVDDGKFQESLDMSMKILQKDPNNKSGLYLVASSFAGLGKVIDAQNRLNHLYSLLTKP